jgi:hypothetical protein
VNWIIKVVTDPLSITPVSVRTEWEEMSKPPMSRWSTYLEPDLEGNHVLQSLDVDVLHCHPSYSPNFRGLMSPARVPGTQLGAPVKLGTLRRAQLRLL